MLFGKAHKAEDADEKLVKLEAFVERLYPGRWQEPRAVNAKELKATTVLGMHIDEASAKVRTAPDGRGARLRATDMGLGDTSAQRSCCARGRRTACEERENAGRAR